MAENETKTSAADMLARWDAGDIVSTIEMGGMGPGYEQGIQILVFEIIRDYVGQEIPEPGTPEVDGFWAAFGDAAVARSDDAVGGFSGAMVGAAKGLAYNLLRKGWEQCKEEVGADRVTMVSRAWPQVPATPTAEASNG